MTATPTSVSNYHDLISSGKRVAQENKVLEVYKRGGDYTDREVEQLTGIRSNTVSARRNELVEDGLVVFWQTRKCGVTGKTVQSWKFNSGSLF